MPNFSLLILIPVFPVPEWFPRPPIGVRETPRRHLPRKQGKHRETWVSGNTGNTSHRTSLEPLSSRVDRGSGFCAVPPRHPPNFVVPSSALAPRAAPFVPGVVL